LKTKPTPVRILDDGEQVVKDPVTGQPVTDPLMRFAILNGFWYTSKKGVAQPSWHKITAAVMPHWEIPRYFGFTEEEQQVYYKICSEAFYPLRSVGYLLGLPTPAAGIRWVVNKHIPLYKIDLILYVFTGDIVRGIHASRVDYDDPVVRAVLERNQARRWNIASARRKRRDSALRAEGDPANGDHQKERLSVAQDPAGRRRRASERGRGDRGRFHRVDPGSGPDSGGASS
jgi:hypothetical protein